MIRKLALLGAITGSLAFLSAPAQAYPYYWHRHHRVWVRGYGPYYGPYYHHHHYYHHYYRYW